MDTPPTPHYHCHTYHINDERKKQQKQPNVQMDGIAEDILMHVIVPAAGQAGQHTLPQDF